MNKGLVIVVVLLISALAGMAALYQFYVREMIKDLQVKQTDREQIEQKLNKLETTFYNTKPELIIKTWRQETQPWAHAVFQRTDFFQLQNTPELIEVPENKIPKFFYADEFPKLEDRLRDYVDEKRCSIPSGLTFDAPPPNSLTGSNPSAEEVEKWMNDYEYGAYIIRFVADSGASSIRALKIWPPKTVLTGSTGTFEHRRIGFTIRLTYEDLVTFLENLRTSDHFFTVDALMLTNSALRNPNAELTVKMVVAQTHFAEYVTAIAASSRPAQDSGAARSPKARETFKGLFANMDKIVPVEEDSLWTRFRRRWLPF